MLNLFNIYTDTCDTIDVEKEAIFTLTEMAAAKRELKSGKAFGEDKIRPERLKANLTRIDGHLLVANKSFYVSLKFVFLRIVNN